MLGKALCKRLAEEHEVAGIDKEKPSAVDYKLSVFYQVDLTDRALTVQKIEEANPDIIIHCAACTDVDGCELDPQKAHRLNVIVTSIVAEGCKLTSAHMIYLSTDFVFDGEKKSPYKEKDKPNPINVYGKTKLESEKAVEDELENRLIIRSSWLFGKGGKNFVDAILKKAETEKELKVVEDQVGCPTYAVDLAEAIAGIISVQPSADSGQLLHITNSGSCSWHEFAKEIINQAGVSGAGVVPISSQELNRSAKRPKMSALDTAEFHKLYNRDLPNWQDALGRYLKERKDSR